MNHFVKFTFIPNTNPLIKHETWINLSLSDSDERSLISLLGEVNYNCDNLLSYIVYASEKLLSSSSHTNGKRNFVTSTMITV